MNIYILFSGDMTCELQKSLNGVKIRVSGELYFNVIQMDLKQLNSFKETLHSKIARMQIWASQCTRMACVHASCKECLQHSSENIASEMCNLKKFSQCNLKSRVVLWGKNFIGQELNPDQLLGRQLCWPIYHRCRHTQELINWQSDSE